MSFNGKDIRLIFKDSNLEELSVLLPVEAEPFLNYLKTIRELHFAVISKEFSYSRCESAVFNFEINFWHLHENMSLPMTLKVHVMNYDSIKEKEPKLSPCQTYLTSLFQINILNILTSIISIVFIYINTNLGSLIYILLIYPIAFPPNREIISTGTLECL